MSEIAEELARRASPQYIKSRASEATMDKVTEIKERTFESRVALAIVGGVIGATMGALMARGRERKERYLSEGRDSRRYEPEYEPRLGPTETSRVERGIIVGPGVSGRGDVAEMERVVQTGREMAEPPRRDLEGAKEQAKGAYEEVKEQAKGAYEETKEKAKDTFEETKEKAKDTFEDVKERASHLREKIPSGHEVRRRASDAWDEQPLLIALLSLVAGALLGIFLPVSSEERRLLGPAKHKAAEGVRKLGERADEALTQVASPAEQSAPPNGIGYRDAGTSGVL